MTENTLVEFVCSHCGHSKQVKESYLGKSAKCPVCNESSIVGGEPPVNEPPQAGSPRNTPLLILTHENGNVLEVLLVYTDTVMGSHLGGLGWKLFDSITTGASHVTSKAICRVRHADGTTSTVNLYMFQIEDWIESGAYVLIDS